jgi:cysteine desulfurase
LTGPRRSGTTLNLHIPTDDIYLDHAATTPVDPHVVQAMLPYYTEMFGNPSSIYRLSQDARAAIDRARIAIARSLGCQPSEILFTSGATESNNLALSGVAWSARSRAKGGKAPHIITTAVEHHAVLHAAEWLQELGFDLTAVPCDADGLIDPDTVRAAIRPETCLVSVIHANNEVGTLQPVSEIAAVAREHEITMHTDAVQSAGFYSLDVDAMGVDLLSLSAHKFYGPKAVGVLYIRKGMAISYLQRGGGQESGRRGGTENVPSIAGMGLALEIATRTREAYCEHSRSLRDRLWRAIEASIDDATLNGPPLDFQRRLPNNLNVTIGGVQGETVLLSLDMLGVAASAGSACTTGNTQPSHVLTAMGLSPERARASLRLTTGRCNTVEDIDEAVEALSSTVSRIRDLAVR